MDYRRRRLLAVVGTGTVGALAGCGGDDGDVTSSPASSETQTGTLSDGEEDNGSPETVEQTETDDNPTETPEDSSPPSEQVAKLAADDGDSGDRFGSSGGVSGDGSTAIFGAIGDEDPNGDEAGSAYVFSRSGEEWQQEPKLAADDGDSGDEFGSSVGVSGDGSTAVIGAFGDEAGSGYVFE
ncbi:MAG: hypothetical protein V5A46_03970 [Haloferacaceae archaeon]